ncbi:PTS galactitol transporter subunit IIC [Hutsoniella sourekii]
MEAFVSIFDYILDLGPTVIIPLAIFLIGLLFGVKPGRAFTSAITIGIGFTGVNLVIGLLSSELGTATQQMVERFNFNLTVVDIGWPAAASAAFASPVTTLMIVLILVVNLGMLVLNLTNTLNIDIWNFHHMIAVAALSYIATNNFWLSIIIGLIATVIILKFSDYFAHSIGDYYGLDNVTFTTGSSIGYAMIGIPVGRLVGMIPGINKVEVTPESIQKRFGIFGEPMVMGLIIGFVLGLLAGYDVGAAFKLGVSMAAVLVLMPRMVSLLMDGLLPISEAAQEFANKHWGDRDINIGLDAALAFGDPANASAGLILVPITLLLAVILPGNKVLPFGDLATIPFYMAYVTADRKGNIFQSVITGTIMIAIALYIATNFAPLHTEMVAGLDSVKDMAGSAFTSFDTGGNVLKWALVRLAEFINGMF